MKKILTSVLCVGMAAMTLASCSSSKKYDPNANLSKVPQNQQAIVEVPEYEIPEEEQVYTVSLDMFTNTLKIDEYTGEAEELVIPATLTHVTGGVLPVTEIGAAAFLGNETLKSVTIPEGVTALGSGAFESCTALKTVVLPETLTEIGDNAFYNTALEEINIPATVTSIGYHAFSSQLNPTPWYESLTDDYVIVGDGILLKCNISNPVVETEEALAEEAAEEAPAEETQEETPAEETTEEASAEEAAEEAPAPQAKPGKNVNYLEIDISEVKHIAYDAFSNSGALAVRVGPDNLKSVDRHAIFVPGGTDAYVKFLVPYVTGGSEAETALKAVSFSYELVDAPGNPFKWTFDTEEDIAGWLGSQLDVSYSAEGALYGKSTGGDPIFYTTDKLNLPAETFDKLVIRMKHNIPEEKSEANKGKFHIQVFFGKKNVSFNEPDSIKVEDIEQTSNGEYVEYTLNMADKTNWTGIITSFRIDVTSCADGDFWLDSVEFTANDPGFDFGTLLKPRTPTAEEPENPFKFKFEEEALATAWAMSGFDYSYESIVVDGDNDSIHGVVSADAEASITSPELEVPGFEYRELIVRMRYAFDAERTEENADNFKIKVYFDNGEGFSEDRCQTVDIVSTTSGEEKIEHTLDMYEIDGWYGTIKAIKIVPCTNLSGEFWIDKIEFVPENKLSRAEFIYMLYEAELYPEVTTESPYRDVVIYDDYCNAVIWAVEKGIIVPEAKTFEPDKELTAAEYAVMINKYAEIKDNDWRLFDPEEAEAPVYEMDAQTAVNTIAGIIEEPEVEEVVFVDEDPANTWTFKDESEVAEWTTNCVEASLVENSLYGKIVPRADGGYDPTVNSPALTLNADENKTLKIKMKYVSEDEAVTADGNRTLQVYFNNGTGLSEANSVKVPLDLENGDFVEYTLDMGANEGWTGTVSMIRIDPSNNVTGEFWIESIAFAA